MKSQSGLTLTELMIAMFVSSLVSVAGLRFFISQLQQHQRIIAYEELSDQVRLSSQLIRFDLQKAKQKLCLNKEALGKISLPKNFPFKSLWSNLINFKQGQLDILNFDERMNGKKVVSNVLSVNDTSLKKERWILLTNCQQGSLKQIKSIYVINAKQSQLRLQLSINKGLEGHLYVYPINKITYQTRKTTRRHPNGQSVMALYRKHWPQRSQEVVTGIQKIEYQTTSGAPQFILHGQAWSNAQWLKRTWAILR